MCHSRFKGAFLGAASLALASHAATCVEAQEPGALPPVVIQPPRVAPRRREDAAPRPSVEVRSSRVSRSRRKAPSRTVRSTVGPTTPVAPTAASPIVPTPGPAERGYSAAPTGLNLKTPASTGSRLGLTPFQTPASIEIIPGQKIQERGQNTVAEAITQNATGITNVGAPGNGFQAYTSRGFAGNGSVMNLYDGTRTYVAAGTVTFPFDTWNIDRIEVLRGPASVLYGEGAIGGVVNIVPKKPTFVTLNEVRAAYGSDNTRRLAWDSGGAISPDVAYRFNISGNQSDGWLKQNGEFRNLAVSGALLWQVNPDFALTLSHDAGYNEPLAYFGTPTLNGKLPRGLRFQNYNVDDNRIIFKDNITQLKAEWTITPDITVRNMTYYLDSQRFYRDVESYAFLPNGRINRSDYIEINHNLKQFGNRADLSWKSDVFGMANTMVVGFDANHIEFKRTGNSPYIGTGTVPPFGFVPGSYFFPASNNLSPTLPDVITTTDQAAVFAENKLQVTDQFALVGGVRYEAPHIKRDDPRNFRNSFKTDFEALTYRFGAVYNPLPETALFVQYATGVDPIGNLVTTSLAQKDLRLTTGRQIEGGIKQRLFGDLAEVTLTGYHIVKDNLLTPDPLRPTATVQVGSQSATGFEAFASVKLHETLRVEGNVAILDARYEDYSENVGGVPVSRRGKQPVNVPEEVANLWVSWAFWPRWEARVGMQYVGPVFNNAANTSKRPDTTILNASIDYRVTDNSRVSLRGYNLTDEVYAVTGSSDAWLLGRPRSFELAYSIAF